MKTIQKLLFLVLILQSASFSLSAQTVAPVKSLTPEKPLIFSALPEKFECSASVIRQLFGASVNDQVSISLTGNITFRGTVSARVQRDPNVMSVNVLSSNFPGTLLNISLITNPDKSEKMIGRFLNPRNGDVLVIDHHNDRLVITKDAQKFVLAECPLPGIDEDSKGI